MLVIATSVSSPPALQPSEMAQSGDAAKPSASPGIAWLGEERGSSGLSGSSIHSNDNVERLVRGRQMRQMVAGTSRLRSTEFLQTLRPESNTGSWSRKHAEVTNAHHKLGKNVVAWLYEHMTSAQQRTLKDALHFDWNAGALALCRLPSNLISARTEDTRRLALSGNRIDDPMNNRHQSKRGEEFLDLIHQEDGALSPRSEVYAELAHTTVWEVYNRYQDHLQTAGEDTQFVLRAEEAAQVIWAVRYAEILNLKIEGGSARPSHFNGDAWKESSNGRFAKRVVAPISREITEADIQRFDVISEEGLQKKRTKRRLRLANRLPNFRTWLNMQQDVTEDIYEMDDRYQVWCQGSRIK